MIIRVARLIARFFGPIRLRFKRSTPLVQPMACLRVDDCLHALEPRFMFDAAGVAVGAEAAADAVAQEQADQAIDALSNDSNFAESGDNTEPSARDLNDQLLDALATYEPPADRREIVFIDTTVEDYQILVSGIDLSAEVVLLDADRDGVEQIAEVLVGRTGVDAIHIVSHGNQAELFLGAARLTLDSMSGEYKDELELIGQALTGDADVLVYGCNYGEGELGQEAAMRLTELTGADVAASTDLTGSVELGGDWHLEYTTGLIEAEVAVAQSAQEAFTGLLATVTVDIILDENDGDTSSIGSLIATPGGAGISLREAIIAANNTAGTDTINLPSGTYTLTIGGFPENAAVTGDLDINDDVIILGANARTTVIDGNSLNRVFHIRGNNTATMSGMTIQGGIQDNGGGIFVNNTSTLTLTDAMLTGNTNNGTGNAGSGGAIHVHGTANLDRVLFSGNNADQGGAIGFHGANGGSLTNVTISGNTATGNGGGIWTDSPITVTNSTITLNNGNTGGGISTGPTTVTISNTIVSDNTATNSHPDVHGNYSSNGFNLVKDPGLTGDFGSDITGVSANLVGLADNGGPTQTHALQTGSLAIDAGTTTGAPTVDQRGFTRDGTPDIGAFEFGSGVNEAPVNMVPVAQTTNQDTTLVFSSGTSNQISISDPDAGGSDVQVTLTATNGTVTLAGTTGLTFSIGNGTADATMTFTGTIANINTALNGLMFDPTASYSGPASLEIITEDQGNTGAAPLDGDANITTKYTFDVDGTDAIGTNDATLNNGAAVVADAERGNVLTTDGVDDYAEVPAAVTNGLSQFTFSFWVKTTESRLAPQHWHRPTLFGMEIAGFGSNDFAINTNNGFIGAWTGLSGTEASYLSTTTQINDNQWHQITVSNDGANASLYVDGVFETSLATGNGLANNPFYIGAQDESGSPARYHSGFFDDVRIFDRSLTTQEVGDLYGLSDTDSVAITVTANSAPTLDLDADDSSGATGNDYQFTFAEGDGPTAIADSDTDVADVASTTFDHVTLSIGGLLDGNAERLVIDGDTFALATDVAAQDTSGGNYHVAITTGAGTAEVTITKQGGGTFNETETETLIESLQYQHTDTSAPTDGDRLIDVTVNDGTSDSAAARTTIDVSSMNDAPVITSDGGGAAANINAQENQTSVTTVTATDVDVPADTLTFSINGGADAALFSIDGSTGVLTFTSAPDFEISTDFDTDGVYEVTAQVADGNGGVDTQAISVMVTDANDAPAITSDGGGTTVSVNAAENQTSVTTVTATDADVPADTLTFSLSGGADAGLFSIDGSTGVLTFNSARDFEIPTDANADGVYEVIVQVDDGNGGVDTQAISVTVTPDNDNAPVITSPNTATVLENTTAVHQITAIDADLPGDTLSYSIAGSGVDDTSFTIDSAGNLSFLAAPDFEVPADADGNNVYTLDVVVSDGVNTTNQTVTVTVAPVNDNAPVITSPNTATVLENTTAVHRVTATDADLPGDTLSYSIAGSGVDDTSFTIDSGGNLSFLAAPDFEIPADADGDNVYTLDVVVSDGVNTTNQTVTVTVTSVNDNAPVITSPANATVVENSTAVGQIAVSDGDLPGDGISYRLTGGGADDGLFTIDAGGNLSFLTAPDFEVPADADGDNVYVVEVAVTDGMNTITQTVAVTVAEANAPVLISPISNEVTEDPDNIAQVDASEVMLGEVVATGEVPVEPIEDQLDTEVTTAPEEPAPKVTQPEPADRGSEAGRDLTRKRESEEVTIPWLSSRSDISTDILDGLRDSLPTSQQPIPAIEPIEMSGFIQELDRLRTEIDEDGDLSKVVIGSSVAVTTGLSIGYVVWLVRGAVLLSSMLSSLPAWRMVDPLPVLVHLGRRSKKDGDDEESLQTVIQKGAEVAKLKRSRGEPDR